MRSLCPGTYATRFSRTSRISGAWKCAIAFGFGRARSGLVVHCAPYVSIALRLDREDVVRPRIYHARSTGRSRPRCRWNSRRAGSTVRCGQSGAAPHYVLLDPGPPGAPRGTVSVSVDMFIRIAPTLTCDTYCTYTQARTEAEVALSGAWRPNAHIVVTVQYCYQARRTRNTYLCSSAARSMWASGYTTVKRLPGSTSSTYE